MRILKGQVVMGVASGCALGLALFAAQPAAANPAFAKAASKPCGACHQPGQETDAPQSGFTANGQTVYNAFIGSCNYHMDCAIQSAFGSAAPSDNGPQRSYNSAPGPSYDNDRARYPGRREMKMVKFKDDCFLVGTYFTVRMGDAGHLLHFKLENGHKVHIELPASSTYASNCGGWPAVNANFQSVD